MTCGSCSQIKNGKMKVKEPNSNKMQKQCIYRNTEVQNHGATLEMVNIAIFLSSSWFWHVV